MQSRIRLWGAVLWLGAVVCLLGCHNNPPSAPSGMKLATQADLTPTRDPGPKAKVVLAGTSWVVELKTKTSGDEFEIDLAHEGSIVDHEYYRYGPSGFAVQRAAGETYSPPLPLLKFPMSVGDSWTWKGTIGATPDEKLPAEATITSSKGIDYYCDLQIESVEVDVHLVIQGKIRRDLRFFFSKDKGLFRREFGASSIREPQCE